MGLTEELYLERLRRVRESEEITSLGASAFIIGCLKGLDDHLDSLNNRVKELEEEMANGHNEQEGETTEGGGSTG